MRLDKYSNPIFNEKDLFEALYRGYNFNSHDIIFIDNQTDDIKQLEKQLETTFHTITESQSIDEYDSICQQSWFMPDEYLNLDIEAYILNLININDHTISTRVAEELEEFNQKNMYNLLKWLVYFVDTCTKNNIVWGVGRGSSVSSYILYLIGVHQIDSIKYNLDWREFLR